MADRVWKQVERRVATFFGTQRNRLSGSSGRSDESSSDSIHPALYVEVKHGDLARFLNTEGRMLIEVGTVNAKHEGKRFVAVIHPKGGAGFWILVHSSDFLAVAKETMARSEA